VADVSSTADILAKLAPALDAQELEDICRLSMAITHAIACAHGLTTTLDPRARALIVTKLQEADHWCLELTRIAAK
jgi:hypothetical protein